MTTTPSRNTNILATLRALTPVRPMSFGEHLRIAELQASRFLQFFDCQTPPFTDALILSHPRIDVQRRPLLGPGMTTWSRGQWRVRINSAEPATRQRFTLAHELKHILDASSEDKIYGHLPPGPQRTRFIELVCDHFAACLLMPKSWLVSLWGTGVQDLAGLAWRFEVSPQAVFVRLQVLGLVQPMPRCTGTSGLWRSGASSATIEPDRTRVGDAA